MRKKDVGSFILFVIASVFLSGEILADDVLKNKTVYVWNFDAKDTNSNDLAESVTDEFEQALIKSRTCIVLQRRHYQKLFNQRQQEQGRKGLEGFDKEAIKIIKSKDADLVIFGEVHDDNASGQIKISAFIQNFDSQILASESVYGPRRIKLDPQSRMEHVTKLVGMLTPSESLEQTPAAEKLFKYIQITIQTPIRDENWNAVDVARRGEKFKFTGNIVKSPKGNKYYEIELGKNNISKAYIWEKESELIKDK